MARIALDAMGGDYAPAETVAGAVDAARRGVDVILVGPKEIVTAELERLEESLPVVDAPEVIGMGDDPARALREKPQSSIAVCARMVAAGEAAGFVGAGSTGAAMAAASILIGRIQGVSRPAIATIFPTPETPTLVLDSGANPEVTAAQLHQFAVMGSVAAELLLGVERPRVGLLNIGEEKGKGRDLERAAHDLLEGSGLNFIGNVEGRDVAADRCDVVVTDGFTGNVFLKTTEGASKLVGQYFQEAVSKLPPDVRAQVLPALNEVRHRLDPETYGGAQLLGVKGVAVIGHGSSSRVAIANALSVAAEGAERDLPGIIAARLA
ncbi:MAG: phosphate acyltransferase PlsX [Acidimicrobiales bacterium]|nr:phosphate acyltransferase PlsX [Acidimicrobiales bacterium]HLV90474.1 phosphate acyltransferase PlsX [Acidimicrobiia bacterium]